MSDDGEPIAKRTRLSVSRTKKECKQRTIEMQRELRGMFDDMMEKYYNDFQLMVKLNVQVTQMRTCVMTRNCNCKKNLFEMELKLREFLNSLKSFQSTLFHSKQIMDHILVDKLHPYDCTESDECLLRMQRVLIKDPLSLERKREIQSVSGSITSTRFHRHSPLHDAVRRGHIKCIRFLLENGAKVTSLTTFEDDTILHTLYDSYYIFQEQRLEILKLLLQYEVSCMFHHNQAGQYALKTAISEYLEEEVSVLLRHGATLNCIETGNAVCDAWGRFNLQMIKLLLLRHPKRLNFRTGSYFLCKELIKHCYKKMVLPGVPLDLCHEKLLEALEFYKTFGGKFQACHKSDSSKDLMQYLKCYKHKRHFNGATSRINALISNPLSLKEISRLAVRKCIRKDYVENIQQLEVPKDLQPFLRFDDITITEVPDDFDCYGDDEYSSSSGSGEDEADEDSSDSDMEL